MIPGLGQLTQGRIGKGILFLVSLYTLFFYGMYLGKGENVYLPDNNPTDHGLTRLASDIYTRFQFVGQFPIGMVAWPAVYQYMVYDPGDKRRRCTVGCVPPASTESTSFSATPTRHSIWDGFTL